MLKKIFFAVTTFALLSLPATEASHDELIRRLSLDLMNRLPLEKEYFKAKKNLEQSSYEKLVDVILESKDFEKTLADKLIDHYKPTLPKGFDRLKLPLRKYLIDNYTSKNGDFRHFIKDYLTAEGIQYSNPMTIFYASEENAPDIASRVSQRVFGLPLNCTRCHDHMDYPELSQSDFWNLSSFFLLTKKTQIDRKKQMSQVSARVDVLEKEMRRELGDENVNKIRQWIKAEEQGKNVYLTSMSRDDQMRGMSMIGQNKSGYNVISPQIYVSEKSYEMSRLRIKFKKEDSVKTAYAKFFKSTVKLTGRSKPRQALAKWAVSDENPYTSLAITNWVTHWILGQAWTLPVSNIYNASGPGKTKLEAYNKYFKETNWDLKKLIKKLVLSKEYRRATSELNNDLNFATFQERKARHLSGPQIMYSLVQYDNTKSDDKVYQKLKEFRLQKDIDRLTDQIFPMTVDDVDTGYTGTLAQTLFIANNDSILNFIRNFSHQAYKTKTSPKKWVNSLFISLYTRPPSSKEISFFSKYLNNKLKFEDSGYFEVMWAIFNSPELRLY
ncbi:MAG: DUF1549 domain-containing protein [Lentisphaeraceae bacterium]|nr:DUF1549 domain-containing protein [Lentisphaeraceae bacterium]